MKYTYILVIALKFPIHLNLHRKSIRVIARYKFGVTTFQSIFREKVVTTQSKSRYITQKTISFNRDIYNMYICYLCLWFQRLSKVEIKSYYIEKDNCFNNSSFCAYVYICILMFKQLGENLYYFLLINIKVRLVLKKNGFEDE